MKIKLNKSHFIKILIIIILSIGIAFLSLWIYRQYKRLKEPLFPAIYAIPDNTVFFVEIKKYNELWSKLNQPASFWNALSESPSFEQINQQILTIDSLIKGNSEIYNIINTQPIYIVLTLTNKNQYEVIFLTQYNQKKQIKTIENFINKCIKDNYHINNLTKDGFPLFELAAKKSSWYYSLYKGVFIASQNKNEVISSVLKLNSNEPITKKEIFNKIYNTSGKNVDANFYLNLNYFKNLVIQLLATSESMVKISENIKKGWLALDMMIKSNNILLNGFINNQDTTSNLLNIFKNEQPQTIKACNILPDNTSIFFYIAYNDFENFRKALISLNYDNTNNLKIEKINNHYHIEIEKYFKYWIGNEMMTFSSVNPSNEKEIYHFFALNTVDKKTASEKLFELGGKTNSEAKIINYKEYKIGLIDIPDILSLLTGFMSNNIKQNYFTIIDNYVVFGNSIESIKFLIDKLLLHQNLINNDNYKAFAENLSDKASIYLYINFLNNKKAITNFANTNFKNAIENNYKVFEQFHFFSLQISAEEKLYYNSICLNFKTPLKNKKPLLNWQLSLDTPITSKPFVIRNYIDKSNEIIIFDEANQLYLIDKNGEIKWKKAINDKILSNIYQIDYFKNGKLQFLFNTQNNIFLVDRNGNDVEYFPIRLKSKATNGLLTVYYPDIDDYRIYLACENKKILCLTKTANLVDGWQFKNTDNTVKKTMQHFSNNNSDYLIVVDTTNKIYILERKGTSKFKIDNQTSISENNSITINKSQHNINCSFVFTNKNGEIINILLPKGKITAQKIKEYPPEHYFLFADVNNDKQKEYLFLHNNNLEIYNHSQKPIYSYTFPNQTMKEPSFIGYFNQALSFAINDNKNNCIYFFSYKNGSFNLDFSLPNSEQYSITSSTNNQNIIIYSTFDKNLYNYTY